MKDRRSLLYAEINGQVRISAASRKGKNHLYPMDKRLGGPQIRSGGSDEKEKLLVLPGIEPRSLARREHDCVTEHCVQVTVHFCQAPPIRGVVRST
jgi:hypothetical protein